MVQHPKRIGRIPVKPQPQIGRKIISLKWQILTLKCMFKLFLHPKAEQILFMKHFAMNWKNTFVESSLIKSVNPFLYIAILTIFIY